MSPVLKFNADNKSTLSYITTGGQIEIYMLFKGTPKQIISAYQKLVGLPVLPPIWSLGWHASSFHSQNQDQAVMNINGYTTADMPLEGIWLGYDYLNQTKDFTVNTTAFPSIKDFASTLQVGGQKLVLEITNGLSSQDPDGTYYKQALDKDALIDSTTNPDIESGKLTQHVLANKTVFLDFFSEDAKDIWRGALKDLHDQVPFDGLWLNFNEAYGKCNGECPSGAVNHEMGELYMKHFLGEEQVENHNWFTSYSDQNN
jgi:alpha-glucosidase (family GH31 glycosyl hydrolase)